MELLQDGVDKNKHSREEMPPQKLRRHKQRKAVSILKLKNVLKCKFAFHKKAQYN